MHIGLRLTVVPLQKLGRFTVFFADIAINYVPRVFVAAEHAAKGHTFQSKFFSTRKPAQHQFPGLMLRYVCRPF